MNKLQKGTMARLMEYVTARHKREFAAVVGCILISVIAVMIGNSFMQIIIDDYILKMIETGGICSPSCGAQWPPWPQSFLPGLSGRCFTTGSSP